MGQNSKQKTKTYVRNRKARFDYQIIKTFEAGLLLTGHEAKGIKSGKAILTGAFVVFQDGKPILLNASIKPYQPNNTPKNYEESRSRELLLNKKEINELIREKDEKGLTIVPISLYNKGDLIKVEIALAKRKKKVDKREAIKKRDVDKRIRRVTR